MTVPLVPADRRQGVGSRVARGAAWTVALRLFVRGLGLVSTVILARLLVPEDFGLVAMAAMVLGLLEVIGDFGFDLALIRYPSPGRILYDTGWTLGLIRGAVIALAVAVVAEPAAEYLGEPRLSSILYVFAGLSLLESLRNVGVIDFVKYLDMGNEFVLQASEKVAAFVVTIVLALLWRNYWALVLGAASGRLIRVGLSYAIHPFRPRLALAAWREIFGFSQWILLNSILSYVSTRTAPFALGKLNGASSVGLYSVAYEISTLATTELVMPIRRALFPGFALLVGDAERLRAAFLKTYSTMFMVVAPAAVGIGLVAAPLVRVMLGSKWVEVIPLIEVLAIYGLLSIPSALSSPLYMALGRPWLLTVESVWGFLLLVPAVVWGVHAAGALGAAWGTTAAAALWMPLDLYFLNRTLAVSPWVVLVTIWRSMVSITVMAAVVLGLEELLPVSGDGTSNLVLPLSVFSGATVYVAVHLLLWRLQGSPDGGERWALETLRGLGSRVRSGWSVFWS